MTTFGLKAWEQSIQEAMISHASANSLDLQSIGKGWWSVAPAKAPDNAVEVRIQYGYVLCTAALPPAPVEHDVDTYLQTNPMLPGCCKVVLVTTRRETYLREDIPLASGFDAASACVDAVTHLMAAQSEFAKKRPGSATSEQRTTGGQLGDAKKIFDALDGVCDEAGWPCIDRDGNQGSIVLGLSSGLAPAVLEERSDGYVAKVRLRQYRTLSDVGRRAVAVLMLSVNGIVRFVRAGIERSAEGWCAFLETRFSLLPSPSEVRHALSALTVGSRMCERELRALSDDALAQRYLDARGMSLVPAKVMTV